MPYLEVGNVVFLKVWTRCPDPTSTGETFSDEQIAEMLRDLLDKAARLRLLCRGWSNVSELAEVESVFQANAQRLTDQLMALSALVASVKEAEASNVRMPATALVKGLLKAPDGDG